MGGLTEHMAVSIVSRFRVKLGVKWHTAFAQASPELQFVLCDEWRDIRRNNVENHWKVFWAICLEGVAERQK